MGNCKNCKWWIYYTSNEKECDFSDSINDATEATRFELYASAADDTNLSVSLFTGPDFGCIHYKHEMVEGGLYYVSEKSEEHAKDFQHLQKYIGKDDLGEMCFCLPAEDHCDRETYAWTYAVPKEE